MNEKTVLFYIWKRDKFKLLFIFKTSKIWFTISHLPTIMLHSKLCWNMREVHEMFHQAEFLPVCLSHFPLTIQFAVNWQRSAGMMNDLLRFQFTTTFSCAESDSHEGIWFLSPSFSEVHGISMKSSMTGQIFPRQSGLSLALSNELQRVSVSPLVMF